ncbi:MAG TPA: hypothetical protein VL132_04160, partial [Planctomycetaceae bacterium]|nr:hypothetical protein [Planctomycetaceae bacterium]
MPMLLLPGFGGVLTRRGPDFGTDHNDCGHVVNVFLAARRIADATGVGPAEFNRRWGEIAQVAAGRQQEFRGRRRKPVSPGANCGRDWRNLPLAGADDGETSRFTVLWADVVENGSTADNRGGTLTTGGRRHDGILGIAV